ncbi:PHD and RING finger domain-containing protein 1 isoform 2-T6 [Thomomys bottae]
MDDDSLDELVAQSPGPGECQVGPLELASDAEESSDEHSGDSEDDTDMEDAEGLSEEEDLEDRSGSEDSEDDVQTLMAATDTQGKLEPSGALSSDDDSESCPICLNAFRDQALGTPETCTHYFCLDCIVEWSRNANSCPVDRTIFKCICIRAEFGGKILKKIPVENTRAPEEEEEEEDPTFCEVCGRCDREDRLLLCDGCDAGYHMECLDPPLEEVPVDEWFCPECAAPGVVPASDTVPVSEEEVSLLLADVVPTTSRLRPHTGRTRAIARTRQSERVRATVNRNRISTASRVQHVPRYLMSSLLDETIEAVATGLSTAVYQRPLTPRTPVKRRRKTGRRKKVLGRKKTQSRSSVKSKSGRAKSRKRPSHVKKRKGKKMKHEVTARSRIARTLGLRRPVHGTCMPSVYKPADPSLGLMRADIGAASLSLFGDPYELDPFDSEELSTEPPSPLTVKRRVLSRSALQSHQPVARPVSMGLPRRHVPAMAPEPRVEAPVPDLLGSILSDQSLLMMSSADVVIHRDGSLSAKRAAPVSLQRTFVTPARGEEGSRSRDVLQPGTLPSGSSASRLTGVRPPSSGLSCGGGSDLYCSPARTVRAPVRPDASAIPGTGQAQNQSNQRGPRQSGKLCLNGTSAQILPVVSASSDISSSHSNPPRRSTALVHPPKVASRRADISELPRIPKIQRHSSGSRRDPARDQSVEIPSTCISRLTGREGPGQPGQNRAESKPSSRAPREPSSQMGSSRPPGPSSHGSLAPLGASRGKGVGSTFESFRINIPGNTAHCNQLSSPGFCNTFRPVDSKVQKKENPSPLFSIKKTKQLKSEIYDPFDPTGSDSSPRSSSPESLLPSEITRTISIHSPKAPTCQTVRCVTSYRVDSVFGSEPEPEPPVESTSGVLRFQSEGLTEGASYMESRGLEGDPTESPSPAIETQRSSLADPWDDDGGGSQGPFFGSEKRTVTCVTVVEPDAAPSPSVQVTTHRVVELRAPSRSPSSSSSRGRKKAKRKGAAREPRRMRSHTHSGSRDRTSRSASPVVEEHARKHHAKAKARRSSSDRASSQEKAKKKRVKDRDKEWRRGSRGRSRRQSRSRSVSPGSSSERRRKRRRHSESRPRGRECSPPSSLDRTRRHKHQRERSRSRERADKRESSTRSQERRRWSSPSPSSELRAQQPRSRERKGAGREASPAPALQQDGDHAERLPASAGVGALPEVAVADPNPSPVVPPALEVPAECTLEDLDYGDSVEAGHVFDDFSNEAIFIQLDDMSSPPSPESTDSSPERDFPPNPTLPLASQLRDTTLAAIQREVSLIHDDLSQPTPPPEQPPAQCPLGQDVAETLAPTPSVLGVVPVVKEGTPSENQRACVVARPEDTVAQLPLLRSRALVKRVTWNLQEAEGGTPAPDRAPRTLLHRPQEGTWGAEDGAPVGVQQVLFSPLPPPSHVLLETGFPDTDSSQVYSPHLPPAPVQPASIPPYPLVSQPSLQYILQGSLPLAACGPVQSLAPVPAMLATASELAGQATTATSSEERPATPRPSAEKTKKEEYMKKLHMQERAVEEVKLAIKPFYQKREVTKEEYKDILRKAVQKICHSKSGEINPVKVANLVKAYVDKYKHMRRHKKAEAGEEVPAQAEA